MLVGLGRERFCISDEIAMHRCWQLNPELDRLVVRERTEFKFAHKPTVIKPCTVQAPDRG
jgi:hypothetical protein